MSQSRVVVAAIRLTTLHCSRYHWMFVSGSAGSVLYFTTIECFVGCYHSSHSLLSEQALLYKIDCVRHPDVYTWNMKRPLCLRQVENERWLVVNILFTYYCNKSSKIIGIYDLFKLYGRQSYLWDDNEK